MNRLVLALAAALVATPALAQPSPRWGTLDLGAESYLPNIDTEFSNGAAPYHTVFGGRGYLFRVGISRALLTHYGSLELGIRTGYFQKTAKAFEQGSTTTRSGVDTAFHAIPSSLALTYRCDFIPDWWGVPLAPYGRATFERYNWWATTKGAATEKGATSGWSLTGGIGILLDFLDPTLSRELDRESGVNHTYLYFEVTKSQIDDFGSSKSWDLSDESAAYGAGLMFVF